MAAAEQIRKWYQEWKKGKSGKTIEKAILILDDKRLFLEGATVDEIKECLDTFH